KKKSIVYQIINQTSCSQIGALSMAVSTGLSVSSDLQTGRSPWALSCPLLLGLVLFLGLTNVNGQPLLADPDSHWHIAVGRWILEHRSLPQVDSYSFTFAG